MCRKLVFIILVVFGLSVSAYAADDITGNPGLGKTTGWRSLTEAPSVSDYTPSNMLINAGQWPCAFTGKSSNTLTGVTNPYMFYPGDTIYEDDGSTGTVSSVTSSTIVLTDGTNFDTSGSVSAWPIYGGFVDMGAVEYYEIPVNTAPVLNGYITAVETTSGDSTVAVDGNLNLDMNGTPSDAAGTP